MTGPPSLFVSSPSPSLLFFAQQPPVPPEIHVVSHDMPCDVHHHHLTPRSPYPRPAQSRSHSPTFSRSVYASPNLGNSTWSRNPYLHPPGFGAGFHSHSVSPLDSPSQLVHPVYSPSGFISRYMHSISPLDSVRRLSPSEGSASPRGYGNGSGTSSSSPHGPISPLSHEDVHSHISLSFYQSNGFFDQISSLAHTEPRTYYIDDVRSCDSDQAGDVDLGKSTSCISITESGSGGGDELVSSASTWSLNHFNPPSFHTPSSVLYPLPLPSIMLTPSEEHLLGDPSWGYDGPLPPTWVSTEGDEVTDTHASSHDGHVISPALPSHHRHGEEEEADDGSHDYHVTMTTPVPVPVEGGTVVRDMTVLSSDLVLPSFHASPPLLPYPSLPPTRSLPSDPTPLPLKPSPSDPLHQKKPTTMGSQASVSSSADSRVVHDLRHDHRKEYEAGMIDTSGRDSSSNMLAFLDSQLKEDDKPDTN